MDPPQARGGRFQQAVQEIQGARIPRDRPPRFVEIYSTPCPTPCTRSHHDRPETAEEPAVPEPNVIVAQAQEDHEVRGQEGGGTQHVHQAHRGLPQQQTRGHRARAVSQDVLLRVRQPAEHPRAVRRARDRDTNTGAHRRGRGRAPAAERDVLVPHRRRERHGAARVLCANEAQHGRAQQRWGTPRGR